jgi:hypothetical protein
MESVRGVVVWGIPFSIFHSTSILCALLKCVNLCQWLTHHK